MGAATIRALGVDFGEVRIGLALSDETGTLASPLPTLRRRRGKRVPLKALQELGEEHGVTHLVFGLPLELDGTSSDWTREVERAGEALAERLGVPVHFVDERMTSVRAEHAVRSSGLPRHKREEKERVDAAAAALILQTWLDRRTPGGKVEAETDVDSETP
jgi:putative holliday junction resolvase